MRIIRDDFDNLVETFGASRRLATRVGALARRGLYLTETVIEFATDDDGKPLSKLLLSKALLDAANDIDDKSLQQLAAKQDDEFFDDNPVTLQLDGEDRVLSLAEEIAEDEPEEPFSDSTALAISDSTPTSVINKGEARKLLTDDEVSRLKMDLVTSSEAGRRLEAVRKLYLSELTPDTKLKLFLTALRDRDAEVRAEAARALGGLGLDGALTENLAKSARGGIDERVVAIGNLGRVMEKLEVNQRRLGLSLLTEFVSSSEEKEAVQASLGVLAHQLPRLDEDSSSMAARLHKQLVELLQVRFDMYEDAARKVYNTLFEHDAKQMSALLIKTVEEVGQPNLRFFALSLITEHDLESATAPAVIERLIEGLTTGSELDRNFQACSAALTRLGEKAVPGLIATLGRVNDAGQERVIALLGHMLRGGAVMDFSLKPATVDEIVSSLLSLYSEASAEVCDALLESGFYAHESLTDLQRKQAATSFLESMHDFRFERQVELAQAALESCGHAAIEPLREAMLESAHDVTRLTAAKLLPEVVQNNGEITADELTSMIADLRTLTDEEESEFPDRGQLYVALGRIGAHANVPSKAATELAQVMRERVGHSSGVYDMLEGLGYIAAGENLAKEERLEIGYMLLTVLKKGLPGMSGRIRKNEEGEEVLHFGRETTAYTDMIPRILEGLGRMIAAPQTPDVLHERIAEELIKLWTEITDFKRVWAPAATMTLARLLGAIAMGERRSERMADDIAELLARKLILLPVMQVLSQLVSAGGDSERMDLIAQRAFNELQKRLTEEPAPDIVERRQILETMTSIAKRKKLGERDKDIEHARKVVVEALFDALRDRLFQARTMLEELAQSSEVSETLRADVTRRLKPVAKHG